MGRRFFTLDVFTNEALGGNPLAVVLDSEGLSDQRMQAIAGEFNLSETVFVFPPENEESRAALRIFTPKNELPFAGHPTIGSAVLLATLDGLAEGNKTDFVLEEKVGAVACKANYANGRIIAEFALPKMPTHSAVEIDRDLLAASLGLQVEQLVFEDHQMSLCDAGVPFPVVPLKDLEALAAIQVNEAILAECFKDLGFALELYVYTKPDTDKGNDYHVRLFAPAMGIAEDPATGSAAAAFAAQIMAYDRPVDGEHVFKLAQGVEMGRPSQIDLGMHVRDGALVHATIGGSAVIVSEGSLRL